MIDPIGKFLGSWSLELNVYSSIFRILLSILLAALIGSERSSKRHSAGLRTFAVTMLSTTLAMILDIYLKSYDPNHLFLISCTTVFGIAIISVRSLFINSRSQIKGLTTATALWTCGIIGLALGAGCYTLALIVIIALYCSLSLLVSAEAYLKNRSNHFEIHLELKNSKFLQNFVSTIRRLGLEITDIEANSAYSGSGLSVYSIGITVKSKELKKYKTHKEIIEALRSLDYIYHIEEMVS